MPTHDAFARLTPFERTLPDGEFPARHFDAMTREAEERGVRLSDPGVFAMLTAAVRALDELRAPGGGDDETTTRLAALLFHAYHHHRAGRPLLLVRVPVVRYLLGDTTPASGGGGEAEPGIPASAYVQLPQHLVWTRAEDEARPRSLDGFFWTVPGDGTVHLLAVAGLLEERPGFTVIPLPGVPLDDAPVWAGTTMRADGARDFTTDLPGAELEGLYEVRTAGELLKLGARLDAYLRRFPGSLAPQGGADAGGASQSPDGSPGAGAGPRRSALSHSVVTLD